MRNRRFTLTALFGCLLLLVAGLTVAVVALFSFNLVPAQLTRRDVAGADEGPVVVEEVDAVETEAPPVTLQGDAAPLLVQDEVESGMIQPGVDFFVDFYDNINPGVVSIQIFAANPTGTGVRLAGAGSGFILNEDGYIVTNNHVVANASRLTVVFYDGTELAAEVIGTDDDSDLAVIRVDELPAGSHPLPVGNSDEVDEGQWVVAIGNPFGQQGTMTVGIVSAIGRTIPSLAATGVAGQAYQIPQAIQTDAAINPGNSGGPLLNLQGQVIGVNAQIETGGGVAANAGVGFAIPAHVVQLVVPDLAEQGFHRWPYLGVSGQSVGLALQLANDLPDQKGAYIGSTIPGGPAAVAGIEGSTGREEVEGVLVDVGGDVVLAVNGDDVEDFADLLTQVAFSQPGETITLTVLRAGDRVDVDVELAARSQFEVQ